MTLSSSLLIRVNLPQTNFSHFCYFLSLRCFSIKFNYYFGVPNSHEITDQIRGMVSSNWGGAVASWLVRSTPERAVRVRALAGDSVLCSWARHFTLTVSLSTQVYKWVPAICWGNLTKLRGSDLRWTSILSRGSRNTSSRLMLQKPG